MKKVDFLRKSLNSSSRGSYGPEDILFLTRLNESLSDVDTEEVFDKLTLLILRYIDTEELKIYHFNLNKKSFRLKIYLGDDDTPEHSFLLSRKPLLAHAIFHSQAVKCHSDPSTLYMFLKVKNIPIAFIEVKTSVSRDKSNEMLKLFEGLVSYAGKTLEKNPPVAGLHSFSPIHSILERGAFEEKVAIERRRRELFGMNYSIISLRVSHKDFDYVKGELMKVIRETDFVGYDFLQELLFILLPCTPEAYKGQVRKRVTDFFESHEIKVS